VSPTPNKILFQVNSNTHNFSFRVVLRDVPKEATPEDFASLFPDALAVVIYKNTFPASKFWYNILFVYQHNLIP
jgi:hypothetical protein